MVVYRTLYYHSVVQTSFTQCGQWTMNNFLICLTIPMIKFLTVGQSRMPLIHFFKEERHQRISTLLYQTPKPHHPQRKQHKLIFPSFCHLSNFRFCVRCFYVFALHIYDRWGTRMPFNRFPNFVILMCFCFWMIFIVDNSVPLLCLWCAMIFSVSVECDMDIEVEFLW